MFRLMPKGLLLVGVLWLAGVVDASDPPPSRGPLSVLVQPRADEAMPSDSEKKEAKAKQDSAAKALKQLEKDLKKQHGKRVTEWPDAARAAYHEALDAYGMAWSANYYRARPAQEKADSVADLEQRLGKAGKDAYVVLASSRKEADLVVEILGRKGQAKFLVGKKYLGFDVLPGRITGKTLTKLPREFRPWHADHLFTLHWARPNEPFLRFEVWDSERWQDVAAYAGHTLEELVKANYDLLRPAR